MGLLENERFKQYIGMIVTIYAIYCGKSTFSDSSFWRAEVIGAAGYL